MTETVNSTKSKLSLVDLLLTACVVALLSMLVVSITTHTMSLSGDLTKLLLDVSLIVPFVLALGKAFEIQMRN